MKEPSEVEKMLTDIDFSRGHKNAVWDKVLSRLQGNGALSLEDLDNVVGGAAPPPRETGKDHDKRK